MNKKRSVSNKTIELPEKWVDLYGNYLYRYALFRVYDANVAEDLDLSIQLSSEVGKRIKKSMVRFLEKHE